MSNRYGGSQLVSDNVTKLYTRKSGSDPDSLLEMAKGEYNKLSVIGINKTGSLEVRATTDMSRSELLWLIEEFKLVLLSMPLTGEDEDED